MSSTESPVRVLVAGLGTMGRSHALAYHSNPGFEIAGLFDLTEVSLPAELDSYPRPTSFEDALTGLRPDLVSINTYSDSHAEYAIGAMEQGAHVFVEKPIARTVQEAENVIAAARTQNRKLVIGYILRHHPSWIRLIEEARALGGPYVFRLNLNQQSCGKNWAWHRKLMETASPIVDCGVHYIDVMCQITDAAPSAVRGMGLRLTGDIADDMYNYGHLQVLFEDGSIGWFEAGWGPMMSETAFFVKDIVSPKGSVSIVMDEGAKSDDIETFTRTSTIRVHRAETNTDGGFAEADTDISMHDEPDHQGLCDLEQAFVLKAIREDLDLGRHMDEAVQTLRICLAADESIRTGDEIKLQQMGA